MSPYEAYSLFLSIKMHFTTESYDAIKYNFKVRSNIKSFEKRRDVYQFNKLAKHSNPKGLIISNMLINNISWVGDLFTDEAIAIYENWENRNQSITYKVCSEINDQLDDDFKSNIIVNKGQHPELLKKYRHGKICVETMSILDDVLGFIPYWDRKIQDTVIWPQLKLKIVKYKPFLSYDNKKVKNTIKSLL